MKQQNSIDICTAGDVGRTLLLALLKDAAEYPDRAFEIIQDFVEHPLLQHRLDRDLMQQFLDETRANSDGMRFDIAMTRAELGYQIACLLCPELAPEFLGAMVAWAFKTGSLERAAPYARDGLTKFANARADLLGDWELCLGQQAFDRRAFREASPHFERALAHSRALNDARREMTDLTALAACHLLLRNELEAIRCAAAAEAIARQLGDLDALTKALGDQGNAEFRLRRYERARNNFESALAAAQRGGNIQQQSNWIGMLGNVWAALGDLDKSEDCHRRALTLSLKTGDLESEQADHRNLAATLWLRGRHDESIEHLATALRIAEKRGDHGHAAVLRQNLQEHYLDLGLHEKAAALQHLNDADDDANACAPESDMEAVSADETVESGQPPIPAPETEKKKAPEQPEEVDPEQEWERSFAALMRARDIGRAEQMVEEYVQRHPGSAVGYFRRGLFQNEIGRYKESIASYDQALALDPKLLPAHYNRLNSYAGLRDMEAPRRLYEKQRSDSPLDAIPRLMLGRIAMMSGDLNAGVRELREAHRLAPQDFTIHLALCQGLLEQAISLLRNDFDGAWSAFELCSDELHRLIADHAGRKADAYLAAAELYEKMATESHFQQPPLTLEFGDSELQILGHALHYYRACSELKPHMQRPRTGYSRLMDLLVQFPAAAELTRVARVLRLEGLRDEALTFLTMSLSKEPLAETHFELALANMEENPKAVERSRALIERALELDPGNDEYQTALRRLA